MLALEQETAHAAWAVWPGQALSEEYLCCRFLGAQDMLQPAERGERVEVTHAIKERLQERDSYAMQVKRLPIPSPANLPWHLPL